MKKNQSIVAAGAVIVVGVLIAVLISPMLLPKPVTTQGKVSLEASGASYFGGSGAESVGSMLQAPDGTIYFSGSISGNYSLPYSMSGYDGSMGGESDLFVAHMSSDMKQMLGCTYLGGNGAESGSTLYREPDGDLLVAGWTNSSDLLGLRTIEGASATVNGSAFVLRLSSDLSEMKAGALFGMAEPGRLLVASNDSAIYLAATKKTADLRADDAGYGSALNGTQDGALLLLDAQLERVLADTYIGGSGVDSLSSLRLRNDGSLIVAGTCSAEIDQVPVRRPSFDIEGAAANAPATYSVGMDGFVAIVESDLSALRNLAYVTGPGDQSVTDLEVDEQGRVFILGQTTGAIAEMKSAAYDSSYSGGSNCFVGRMSSDLSSVVAMSYVGESRTGGRDLALIGDKVGVVLVSEGDAPLTSNALDASANGAGDVALVLFDSGLEQLAYGSYVGSGSGAESNGLLCASSDGSVLLATQSSSPGLYCPSGAYDSSYAGGGDLYLGRYSVTDLPSS
jgi:hypothetical protein